MGRLKLIDFSRRYQWFKGQTLGVQGTLLGNYCSSIFKYLDEDDQKLITKIHSLLSSLHINLQEENYYQRAKERFLNDIN